jgi:hypothetical protein
MIFQLKPSSRTETALRVAFALRTASKLVRGLRQGLTEEDRYRVADDVVNQLEKGGWQLSEELPDVGKGHSTPPSKIA